MNYRRGGCLGVGQIQATCGKFRVERASVHLARGELPVLERGDRGGLLALQLLLQQPPLHLPGARHQQQLRLDSSLTLHSVMCLPEIGIIYISTIYNKVCSNQMLEPKFKR